MKKDVKENNRDAENEVACDSQVDLSQTITLSL